MKRALILIVCLLLFPVVPASALVTRPVTVKIFCTGNLHGHAEADFDADGRLREIGYARMKTYMDSQKADLRLLLDAGDVFSGSPLATYSKGRSIGELINAMGYAAVAPGTHDFDHGYDALKELAAKVDLLAINAYENEESAFKPYRLYDIDGLTIGIFGVISPDVSRYAPEGALRFDADLARRCSDIVDELRSDMGVDAVIALTHLGMRPMEGVNARRLAAEVRGIDLIIDGGDHDIVAGEVIGNTTIVSAGEYFQCFGEITLQFNPDEKFPSSRSMPSGEESMTFVPPSDTVYVRRGKAASAVPVCSTSMATRPSGDTTRQCTPPSHETRPKGSKKTNRNFFIIQVIVWS